MFYCTILDTWHLNKCNILLHICTQKSSLVMSLRYLHFVQKVRWQSWFNSLNGKFIIWCTGLCSNVLSLMLLAHQKADISCLVLNCYDKNVYDFYAIQHFWAFDDDFHLIIIIVFTSEKVWCNQKICTIFSLVVWITQTCIKFFYNIFLV